MMTTIDWIILAIITLSTVMSLWRGATREIFSLIIWIAAIYLGVKFAGSLDGILSGVIDAQAIRFAVGFMIIFLAIMILGALLSKLLVRAVDFIGLTIVDRILGLIFGFARGVLILAVLVVLANYSSIPEESWWKQSQLLPHVDGIAHALTKWVQDQGFDPKKLEGVVHSIENEVGVGDRKTGNETQKTEGQVQKAGDAVPNTGAPTQAR